MPARRTINRSGGFTCRIAPHWSGLLGHNAKLRQPQAAVAVSLAAVRTQIERTDRLIDQVVYRLYGLTEEEIAVVEGSAACWRAGRYAV